MTNYEWMVKNNAGLVKESIAKIIGVKKGMPDRCAKTPCYECDFNKDRRYCHDEIIRWLEQERKSLYKKGDIVVDINNQIRIIKEDDRGEDFIIVSSQYSDYSLGLRIPITDIKKKIGHIDEKWKK